MVTTVRHRGLAVAAACVALPAVGGAVSLANGTIDPGTAIVDRFPWQSVELAGLALFAWVAVPFSALAVLAWRGSPRTPQATVAAGLLLVAWIVVQLAIIRTLSFFHPTYLLIGLAFIGAGRRLQPTTDRGPAGPESGTIGPVADAAPRRRIEA